MSGENLPFYCPVFRSDSLKLPCKANLAKIAALQEKGKDCLGVLEKCQECQGIKLKVKAMVTEQQVKPGFCDLHPEETFVIFLIDKPLVDGKFQVKCRSCAQGAPPQAQESPETLAAAPASPAAAAIGTQRVEILKALGKVIKGDGQATSSTLAAKLLMTTTALTYHLKILEKGAYIRIIPGKGPTSPAIIEFAGPPAGEADQVVEAAEPASVPEKEEVTLGAVPNQLADQSIALPPEFPAFFSAEAAVGAAGPPVPCKTCGIEDEIIDKLGRHMGICSKCLANRSKPNLAIGSAHGWQAVNIPLNDPKYAKIKEWLNQGAEELEQTLAQQIMFQLKMAYRRGTYDEQKVS